MILTIIGSIIIAFGTVNMLIPKISDFFHLNESDLERLWRKRSDDLPKNERRRIKKYGMLSLIIVFGVILNIVGAIYGY